MQLRDLNGESRRYRHPSPTLAATSPQTPPVVSPETPSNPTNNMDEKQVSFKEIKIASEAMALVVPKFSGENKNEFLAHWATTFTREANNLALGKQLGALVLPRLLIGKASERYQSIPAANKTDPKTALEELGKALGSQAARNKAMTNLAEARKKPSESLFAFGKRVSENVKVAHPKLLPSEREEMGIHHFMNGLPRELKIKLKEGTQFTTLNKTVERAEALEDILREEDTETVNLIQRMDNSEKDQRIERLEKQVQQLKIANKQLQQGNRNQYFQNGNRANDKPQGNSNRVPKEFNGNQYQRKPKQGYYNEQNSEPSGWQINRAPQTSGLNFLMIVAIISCLFQTTTAQMQICPNEKSGEYFAAPSTSVCKLDIEETVLKTTVDVFSEFGASKKFVANRCSRTDYEFCVEAFLLVIHNMYTKNVTSFPMTKEECDEAINSHTVNNETLVAQGNNIFQTPMKKPIIALALRDSCEKRHMYTLEKGEVATPDGETIMSNLGDVSGCDFKTGECDVVDSKIVWDTEGVKDFCKYSFVQNTTALITKTKVVLTDMQMALSIEQDQSAKGTGCIPNLKLVLNNGFIISFDSKNKTLDELINEISEGRHRVKRGDANPLIRRLFGEEATNQNYPYFLVDPIIDNNIINEMRRFSVTYAHIRHQWETYELPNKQTAVLRAIREAEYRHQMIRQLRENPVNENTQLLIKRLEEPSQQFDQLLINEFGNTRILTPDEKNQRKWNMGSSRTTKKPFLRDQAGEQYVHQIAERARVNTEEKGNAQVNGRVQYASDRISEATYKEFDRIYQQICELQNNQIEIAKALLYIDPTLGMRALLKREDIVARRAGTVYIVTQCRNVTIDKIHLDHRVNGTCFRDTPVTVYNSTWFLAPGMSRDLIKESKIIPCEDVILGVYQNEKGEWISHNGQASVRKIGVNFSKKPEKQNLTLSAPAAFTKLENVENPSTYLIAYLNTIMVLKENQANIAKNMEKNGEHSPEITEIIRFGERQIATIKEQIQVGIEAGKQFFHEKIMTFVKHVIVPIIVVICIAAMIVYGIKIYFLRNASGLALTQFAKLANRAPPSVRTLMKRMRPEINNIVIDDDDEIEESELQVFSGRRKPSLISEPEIYSILTVGGEKYLPYVPTSLNNSPVVALLDSGASVSLIAERVVNKLGLKRKVVSTTVSAKVANGQNLKFQGKIQLVVSFGKTKISHTFLIVRNDQTPAPCLLGNDFMLRLNYLDKEISLNIHKRIVRVGNEIIKLLDSNEFGEENEKKINFVETARKKSKVPRESYKTFYDKRHNVRDTNFQVGEKVLIQDFTAGKLEYKFSSPTTVLETTETTVTVRNHKNKVETIHKNRAKRHVTLESIMEKQKDQQAAQNNDMEGQADETIVGQGMRGKPEGDERMDNGVGSRRFVRRSRLHHESIRRSRRLQGLQPMADTLSQFPI